MKKIVLAMMFLAFSISQMNAQAKFGVKAGLNFNSISASVPSGAPSLSTNNAVGWHAGGMLLLKIPIIGIGLQPEVLYTVKNS